MNLSCSSKMIKYLMFAFNLFFVISGIIMIAVGAAVKTVYTTYADFLDGKYFSLPNLLIATGALIFFISFFGCCGAFKENWIMLGIFSVFLIVIFIFEFSAGIAGYVLRDKTANYLGETLKANLHNYRTESHSIWDLIQEGFACCGVDSYEDWEGVFSDNYSLPMSCCPKVSGTAGVFYCNSYTTTASPATTTPKTDAPANKTDAPTEKPVTTPAKAPETPATTAKPDTTIKPATQPAPTARRKKRNVSSNNITTVATSPTTPNSASTSLPYKTGCRVAFGNYIKRHAVQIGGWAMGIAIIQLLGIIFSCHLVRQLKNGYSST